MSKQDSLNRVNHIEYDHNEYSQRQQGRTGYEITGKRNARSKIKWLAWMLTLSMCAGALAACSSAESGGSTVTSLSQEQESESEQDSQSVPNTQEPSGSSDKNETGKSPGVSGNPGGSMVLEDEKIITKAQEIALQEEDDSYITWEKSQAVEIILSDSGITAEGEGVSVSEHTVTIDRAGTYVLEGTLTNGTIRVDAGADDTVRLVLNGVTVHSNTSAAVDIIQAGKVIISLEEGTVNTLSDSKERTYRDQEAEEPNGTLFSKSDLTINGSGTLKVTASFHNGIQSKGILRIMEGTYEITSENHGIKAKNGLVINGGDFQIAASEGNGMKSDYILGIFDGNVVVSHSDEGLEGETIIIKGGTIDVTSNDDGINASTDEGNTPELYLMGGDVTVRAEGDGIDSNGSIYMSGGKVTVYGPEKGDNGALDYDGEFQITGGMLTAFGPGRMEQNVSSAQGQVSVLVDFQKEWSAGTEVVLKEKDGSEIYRAAGEKTFRTIVWSVPKITAGNEYTIEAGETIISFTPEETVVYVNQDGIQEAAAMGHGGPGGFRGDGPGGREGNPGEGHTRPGNGERPEFGEGGEPPEKPEFREGQEPPEKPKFREGNPEEGRRKPENGETTESGAGGE